MRIRLAFGLLLAAVPAFAESPLRLVPEPANLVLHIEQPRRLVETLLKFDALQQARQLPIVRQPFDTPELQRFVQLVAHAERELGKPWPELLDVLAGDGITITGKAEQDDGPVLFLIHGKDEALAKRFVASTLKLVEEEIARTESKERIEKGSHKGIEGYKLGGDLRMARIGATLLFSNKDEPLKLAIDQHADPKLKSLADAPGPKEARGRLPKDALAWLWLDLKYVHDMPESKKNLGLPTDNLINLLLFGSTLNAIGRAPYVAAGLTGDRDGLHIAVRLPGGHRTLPKGMSLHVPGKGQPGTLPHLRPPGTILSDSFHLDLSKLWEHRRELMNEELVKQFDDLEKNSKLVLLGYSLSKIFSDLGPQHRVVVAYQDTKPYAVEPAERQPAFALVSSMRDARYGRSLGTALRIGAFLASLQVDLKSGEETYRDTPIAVYRFPEGGKFPDDPDGVRFNYMPCFAVVGDQFIASSTVELCRGLIDELKKDRAKEAPSPDALRARAYGEGAVGLLKWQEDQLLARVILDEAIPPAEARKRLTALFEWVKNLGQLDLTANFDDAETRYDLIWKAK